MIKKLFFFLLGVLTLMGVAAGSLWAWLPSDKDIRGCMVTKMYQVELCPGSKNYVPLKQIAPILQKTIILTEDSNFYNHKGFDWDAIEKNAKEGWETGVFKRGGSTITQQLAKNMFLNKDRTFIRKGLEAIITDRIEHTLTKKEILERYLNVVEFGKDIYGVKAAAKYYFKKSPAELTVVESAFLAMVLPNPVKYSQSYYRKELTPFARKRLGRIVDDLFQYHRISQEEYDIASAQVAYFFQPEPPPEEMTSGEEIPTLEELENLESQEQLESSEEVE
ncbi:monofunctional biosynthetic peptidoglycan transglycosylase [Bdellovibrio bacteriovorus]|uniref:Penicillin-binding protein n=1 Tax=Bdellovibrio bacteriovorus (strain ATCC 15356 / DSM 50701 / NCIMB 9529 / HD100) TaxID=264462 RepID=Q6MRE6_BDEBA|nr:monofunctional biosynthetic peptidoglycan transglycosylase [Bdellovibrio bacteriovorus]AHZ85788.1 penicillin-binding protein [Bdellovibrio bacteriovorus]BEV66708.1 Biosynthetic peptidoglycan transglycosylase [Bdellovibrio bacteriovorus]CAE77812.1 penicillin-binding protein [Bdellovibrio bacteriovorus HD100]